MRKKFVMIGCIVAAFVAVLITPLAIVWLAGEYRYARVKKLIEVTPPAHQLPAPIDE